MPTRSIVRLGSTTVLNDGVARVEVNSIEGIRNSASKLKMKKCFSAAGVKTADWFTTNGETWIKKNGVETIINLPDLPYPIVAKSHFGSRGEGNYKLDNIQALEGWMRGKDLSGYIFESFVPMTREYRLHVTSEGCFYTCRKLLKNDAPEGTWQRHDDYCNWALETNPSFKKPNNWNLIVADCIKALNSLGLDIAAFDVAVQGSVEGRERDNPEWCIFESASAPSFGEITAEKYTIEIPKIIERKMRNG